MNRLARDLEEVDNAARINGPAAVAPIDEIFGWDVFSLRAMRQRLPRHNCPGPPQPLRGGGPDGKISEPAPVSGDEDVQAFVDHVNELAAEAGM